MNTAAIGPMTSVLVDEETIRSAGSAVNAIEVGRRVGWAKAFDAMRRADRAEHDLNIARSDGEIFRTFAAQAFGALTEIAGSGPVQDLFNNIDLDEVRKSLPDGPYRIGLNKGRALIARFEISVANNRAKINEMRGKKDKRSAKADAAACRDDAERAWRDAKRRVVDDIVGQFGFVDRQEFWDYLQRFAEGAP